MGKVEFDITTNAINYVAYLKDSTGTIIDSIDKTSSGYETKNLQADAYEARLIIKGTSGSTATLQVTVDGVKSRPRNLKISNNEARGGRGFVVS